MNPTKQRQHDGSRNINRTDYGSNTGCDNHGSARLSYIFAKWFRRALLRR
jgi:hypothetical protein